MTYLAEMKTRGLYFQQNTRTFSTAAVLAVFSNSAKWPDHEDERAIRYVFLSMHVFKPRLLEGSNFSTLFPLLHICSWAITCYVWRDEHSYHTLSSYPASQLLEVILFSAPAECTYGLQISASAICWPRTKYLGPLCLLILVTVF